MDRMIPSTPSEEMLAAALEIFSLPLPVKEVDAFAAFPGQGEEFRVISPIQWWESPLVKVRYLLISGNNQQERTAEPLNLDRLKQPPYNLKRVEGVELIVNAKHTKWQADWVAKMVCQHKDITSLAVFGASWHLLRVYLTTLKSLDNSGLRIPVLPMPISIDLSHASPETGVPMRSLVAGEARRISDYQEKGDVFTWQELYNYLGWLYNYLP